MTVSTPLWQRLLRLWRLVCWLMHAIWHMNRLPPDNLAQRQQTISQLCAGCLHILNVQVQCENALSDAASRGCLVVANHVSWLDILVINTLCPSSFIAMKEIQKWPLLGKLVRNAGTVFIDRSNRKDIDPINIAIAQALQQGDNVCFFPEARTSLGNNVLPLKAALFQSAINAQAPIQILALRYYSAQQRTESVSFSHLNLLQSVWQVVSQAAISVRVNAADLYYPTHHADADRFTIKNHVENYLRQQVLQDSPNPERILP